MDGSYGQPSLLLLMHNACDLERLMGNTKGQTETLTIELPYCFVLGVYLGRVKSYTRLGLLKSALLKELLVYT